MNEQEYRNTVDPLFREANRRVKALVDSLTMQPPIKLAVHEAKATVWWALVTGARNGDAILERARRIELSRKRGNDDQRNEDQERPAQG